MIYSSINLSMIFEYAFQYIVFSDRHNSFTLFLISSPYSVVGTVMTPLTCPCIDPPFMVELFISGSFQLHNATKTYILRICLVWI